MEIQELTIIQRVEAIVRPNLKFLGEGERIDPDQPLGELGLDSLASINLLFDLESEFAITITDDVLDENTFSSINQLQGMVKRVIGI